jgi:hypothetical protein
LAPLREVTPVGRHPIEALPTFLHPAVEEHVHGLGAEDVLQVCEP